MFVICHCHKTPDSTECDFQIRWQERVRNIYMLMHTMVFRGIFQIYLLRTIRQKIIVYLLNGTNSLLFFFQLGLKHTKIQQNGGRLSFYCYPPQLKYNGYNVFYIAFWVFMYIYICLLYMHIQLYIHNSHYLCIYVMKMVRKKQALQKISSKKDVLLEYTSFSLCSVLFFFLAISHLLFLVLSVPVLPQTNFFYTV